MKCYNDIKTLAENKLKDAECLALNNRFDGAYYIVGYTVELYLKAMVCKTLGIEDFFDFDNQQKTKLLKNEGNLYKPYKTHDLEQLLVLSGVYTQFDAEKSKNRDLQIAWPIIIKWEENTRYLIGRTEQSVTDLFKAIKIFEKWILKFL